MVLLTNVPIPLTDPISRKRDRRRYRGEQTDPYEGLLTQPWADYFLNQSRVLEQAAVRIHNASLTGQEASIGATDITDGDATAGVYRLSYYTRITRAATTNSSLTVTLDFTDGSVTPSVSGSALTANTTTTWQSGTHVIRIDGSPVRYSTTYASTGATSMQYSLYVVLERVNV